MQRRIMKSVEYFTTIAVAFYICTSTTFTTGDLLTGIEVPGSGFYLKAYNAINVYRSKHVSPSLKWNRTLNDISETIAIQLAQEGSDLDPEESEGINYFGVKGKMPLASYVVSKWYNESLLYDYQKPGYNHKYLNFTQMVWKSSTTVGIGAAYSVANNFSVVVAKFLPFGNIDGKFKQNVIPPRVNVKPGIILVSR